MKPLIRFIICTGSCLLLLLPKKASRACGFFVAPGEYRFWLLQPNLTNEQDLTPFFFASTYVYKGDSYSGKETYQEQNVSEWYEQMKGRASARDIDTLLYHVDPQLILDQEERWARINSFMRGLKLPQNKELYRYFIFSKKVEQIIANPDPWEEEKLPDNSFRNLIKQAIKLHKEATSGFVQMRTAYQLEKLYAYSGQDDQVGPVYDKWLAPVITASWIKTAALFQKAVSTDGYEGQYLFSKVFDQGGYNRSACLVRFDSRSLDSTLKYAGNTHEQNVLRAMKIFNYPGRSLHDISYIYHNEPGYKELPFLLLREVNKVEDWLVTNKVTSFGMPAVYGTGWWANEDYKEHADENYKKDKAYAQELLAFMEEMIQEEKGQSKALICLYASHLALLQQDLTLSDRLLKEAKQIKKLPENVQTQLQINTYLLHLENSFSQKAEREMMRIVRRPDRLLAFPDPGIMKDQLVLYTARKMIRQGDRARGLMLLSRTKRALGELTIGYKGVYQEIEETASDQDYDQMISILDKKRKTDFERFLVQGKFGTPMQYYSWGDIDQEEYGTYWSRNKLLDGKATWYLRHHELRKARDVLRQIPDSFWGKEPYSKYIGGDAFYLNIYYPYEWTKEDKRWLNKRQVVEEMVRLEQTARENKREAALCYFKLGNAWYNMSYYGKNWLMVKQWWSKNDMSSYDPQFYPSAFHEDYYGCSISRQYYQKAMRSTNNKKLKALCYFMTEVCDKNYRKYKWCVLHKENTWDYKDRFKADKNRLRENGIDEAYYNNVVNECELYQSYIRKYSYGF